MSAWITDRLPTREDAGHTTMVWVSSPREVYPCDYSVVSLGQPWQPITYPEPYQKPKKWMVNTAGVYKNDVMVYWDELRREHYRVMEDALNRLEEGV